MESVTIINKFQRIATRRGDLETFIFGKSRNLCHLSYYYLLLFDLRTQRQGWTVSYGFIKVKVGKWVSNVLSPTLFSLVRTSPPDEKEEENQGWVRTYPKYVYTPKSKILKI